MRIAMTNLSGRSFRGRAAAVVDGLERRVQFDGSPLTLDTSFGDNGLLLHDVNGGSDIAYAVVVQKDGRIVVAGSASSVVAGKPNATASVIVRFNVDGSLDDGGAGDLTPRDKFGVDGRVILRADPYEIEGSANAIALTPDGKFVVAGSSRFVSLFSGTTQTSPYVARLNADGSLDSTFADGGVGLVNLPGRTTTRFNAMTLTADGRVLAVGSSDNDWVTARFTAAGRLDTTFSDDGFDIQDFGGVDTATGVGIDNTGGAIVGGSVLDDGHFGDVGVARYNPDGRLDANFNANGKARYFNRLVYKTLTSDVRVLPGGDVLVAGNVRAYSTQAPLGSTCRYVFGFDRRGHALGTGPRVAGQDTLGTVNGLAVTADQQYVGSVDYDESYLDRTEITTRFEVATAGDFVSEYVGRSVGPGYQRTYAIAIGPENQVVAVGTSEVDGTKDIAVLRFGGLPSPRVYGSISGRVFNDADGDGVQDPGESGLANVQVYIDANKNGQFDPSSDRYYDGGGERDVVTDAAGNYTIAGLLPGTYTLRQTLLSTFTGTLPAGGSQTAAVVANQTTPGHNFAQQSSYGVLIRTTRIRGNVFNDLDLDGVRDVTNPTEPDLAGRVVFLDLNRNARIDSGEPQRTTDASGNYLFDKIAPGSYRVRDVLPAGWFHTKPASGYFDVTVASNQTATARFATSPSDPDDTIAKVKTSSKNLITPGHSLDFTLDTPTDVDLVRFTATTGQRLGFDLDGRDGANPDTYVRIFDSSGHALAANDDGSAPGETPGKSAYLAFTFATAGTYYVGVSPATDRAYDPVTGNGDTYGVAPIGAYRLTLSTLGVAAASIAGFAFDDKNRNGTYETGDVFAAGKTIYLDLDDDGVKDAAEPSVLTDSSGKFAFGGLSARQYHVRRVFSTGYVESTPSRRITLTAGQNVTGVSIGSRAT